MTQSAQIYTNIKKPNKLKLKLYYNIVVKYIFIINIDN